MRGKDLKIKPEDAETIIGAGVKVEGTFNASGNVILKGELVGSLETESDVHLRESGVIQADIKSRNAFIAGEVRGNLEIQEKIELGSSAKVSGDLNCRVLAIEEGAVLKGRCNVGGGETVVHHEEEAEEREEEE